MALGMDGPALKVIVHSKIVMSAQCDTIFSKQWSGVFFIFPVPLIV